MKSDQLITDHTDHNEFFEEFNRQALITPITTDRCDRGYEVAQKLITDHPIMDHSPIRADHNLLNTYTQQSIPITHIPITAKLNRGSQKYVTVAGSKLTEKVAGSELTEKVTRSKK